MKTEDIIKMYSSPPAEGDIVPAHELYQRQETLQTKTVVQQTPTSLPDVTNVLKQDIEEFKGEALAWAKAALEADKGASIPTLEIKEVKDLVSIVTQIEQSYAKKEDTSNTTINILNVIQRYDDDV